MFFVAYLDFLINDLVNVAWEDSRHLATPQMTSEKQAQKFYTGHVSLPRYV